MSHWYEQFGNEVYARHFVEMASRPGELRPTRITDVRKMWKEGRQVVPSVTTILNVLDKAALVNWKVDQHLRIARAEGPMLDGQGLSADEWCAEIKRLTEIEMDKAPQAGTDAHKALEDYMRGQEAPQDFRTIYINVAKALQEGAGYSDWECEKRFTDPRGFGGCADLVGDGVNGKGWVIDYKTKQTADKFKPGKMAYPDHSRQLAAYREGLGIPNARCANVFICIENGEVDFHEHAEEQLRNGWEVFQHALAIWQLTNDYPMTESKAA